MQHTSISLIGATFFIALTHAVMPNHWMPFALIGKGQRWSLAKTVTITAIAGFCHALTTSILGSIIALLGFQITKYTEKIAEPVASIILIGMGLTFVIVGRFRPCTHNHNHSTFSDKAITVSLFAMLSLSPCVAVLPLFLAAGAFNWGMLVLLSIILSGTTVSGMVGLTILAYRGVKKINLCRIEHYEKEIIGGILALVGGVLLFVH